MSIEIDVERIFRKVERKLSHSGYVKDVAFPVTGGAFLSFRRGLEYVVIYARPRDRELDSNVLTILDSIVHVLGISECFIGEISPLGEISLRKHQPSPDANIISRCRHYLRLLSSISQGQWFDHIRHRAKLRARACVDLIRVIRVIEEMGVAGVTWRKWGMGQQHTLIVTRKLSKGELAYYLARLLNIAKEKSLVR